LYSEVDGDSPGAANDLDERVAYGNIAANLDQLLDEYPTITVVLESMVRR
jgi:hypothetical protein